MAKRIIILLAMALILSSCTAVQRQVDSSLMSGNQYGDCIPCFVITGLADVAIWTYEYYDEEDYNEPVDLDEED